MARQVRWAVAHRDNVSQVVEVYHNVGSLNGPTSIFEKGFLYWIFVFLARRRATANSSLRA